MAAHVGAAAGVRAAHRGTAVSLIPADQNLTPAPRPLLAPREVGLDTESFEQALSVAREAGLEDRVRPLVEVRLADLERLARGSPRSAGPAP